MFILSIVRNVPNVLLNGGMGAKFALQTRERSVAHCICDTASLASMRKQNALISSGEVSFSSGYLGSRLLCISVTLLV